MSDQAVAGNRNPAGDHGVDLGFLGLDHELWREHQQHHRDGTGSLVPQAGAQIKDQSQCQQATQRIGQQECNLQVAGQPVKEGNTPHEHRWLVRVELTTPHGDQPLPGGDHFAGHFREPRFVGRPGGT